MSGKVARITDCGAASSRIESSAKVSIQASHLLFLSFVPSTERLRSSCRRRSCVESQLARPGEAGMAETLKGCEKQATDPGINRFKPKVQAVNRTCIDRDSKEDIIC